MKKFTKLLEDIEKGKFFKIKADVELVIPADNEGEASYIADSTLAGIKNMGEYTISNVEKTESILESINSSDIERIAKSFTEWIRHECIVSDEGYFYWEDREEKGRIYDIDDIYKIYMSKK